MRRRREGRWLFFFVTLLIIVSMIVYGWQWWLAGGLFVVLLLLFYRATQPRLSRYIDRWGAIYVMDPWQFEHLIGDLLRLRGWRGVRVTPADKDGGVDIIAYRGVLRYLVQCKRYPPKKFVSVKDLRELYGVAASQGRWTKSLFVTTGEYSDDALAFARQTRMLLWDKHLLYPYVTAHLSGGKNKKIDIRPKKRAKKKGSSHAR